MSWNGTKLWSPGDPLTADDLNTYVTENLEGLKNPPSRASNINEDSNYETTSSGFVAVDSTEGNFRHTITTTGGNVMVHFDGTLTREGGALVAFDMSVDTIGNLGATDGIAAYDIGSGGELLHVSFTRLVSLSAGTHVFTLQWKIGSGKAILFAGANVASGPVAYTLPQFWVREVS